MLARFPVTVLLVASLAAAGCLGAVEDSALGPSSAGAGLRASLFAASPPALDGVAHDAWLASFVAEHAPRVTGSPQEKAAAAAMAGELAEMGFEVETLLFGANGLPTPDGPLRVVFAKRVVAEEAPWILMGAHYDTSVLLGPAPVAGVPVGPGVTIEAAYDNGSGTSFVMELARQLKDVETSKNLGFLLFNGEEEGLLASEAFVAAMPPEMDVDAYVGFDMIGLNWPSPIGCLCLYSGRAYNATFVPLLREVAFSFLQYPDDNASVIVLDNHDTRNSDERSFAVKNLPTIRFAGIAAARDYPHYHQLTDTMQGVYETAGGQELWQQGLETALAAAYYTILALDATDVESAPVA